MYQDVHAGPRHGVRRYFEVFSRHKLILIMPVVIALSVTVWHARSLPSSYVGSTTVWFDTGVTNQSSLDFQQYVSVTPAQQGQAVLQELLGTRRFLVNVGHRTPLAASLTSPGLAPATLDDRIVRSLGPAFGSFPLGPQVLKVTMTARDWRVIADTLDAVVGEYSDEIAAERKTRDQASLSYFRPRLDATKKRLDKANADALDYQRTHPGVTPSTDTVLGQLIQATSAAQGDYAGLQSSYTAANLAVENSQPAANFHMIDPVRDVVRLSNKKKILFTGVAGILAGLIVSILALAALTAADRTVRRSEDIEGPLGLDVVATIRELPRPDRLTRASPQAKSP